MSKKDQAIEAAKNMDWTQVHLNYEYGPPCFFLFDDGFCGRAKRWQGHGDPNHHEFESLADLLAELAEKGKR